MSRKVYIKHLKGQKLIKYKLTNCRTDKETGEVFYETRNNTQWGENVTHRTNGKGDLCGPGWLHYYHEPELAEVFNFVHGGFSNPVLWECEASGEHKHDNGIKGGCTELTTLKQIHLPKFTEAEKIEFGFRCALEVTDDKDFIDYVENYLNGKNPPNKSDFWCFPVMQSDSFKSTWYAWHIGRVRFGYVAHAAIHAVEAMPSLNIGQIAKDIFRKGV